MKPLTTIQKSAKGEACTFNLLECNYDRETTVLCHNTEAVMDSPRKHDLRAAYGCSDCHNAIDGRSHTIIKRTLRQAIWGQAIAKTHVKLLEKGLIVIPGQPHKPTKIMKRRYGELLR